VTLTLRTPRVTVHDYPDGVAISVRATNIGGELLSIGPGTGPSGTTRNPGFGLRAFAEDGRKVIDTELPRGEPVAQFAAGQTRRQRFLVTLGAERPGGLTPGSYTVVGLYAGRESAPARLTVVP
jgi:hypothetical protein